LETIEGEDAEEDEDDDDDEDESSSWSGFVRESLELTAPSEC
jgi:hypothetical protein